VLKVGSGTKFQLFSLFNIVGPFLGLTRNLGRVMYVFKMQKKCQMPTIMIVAPLLWPSEGVKLNTWKSWDLESSGIPKCSELDSKGQNTSHYGFLGVIAKVLKRRYRKWPRIGHLGICSPSYGQKKGQEGSPNKMCHLDVASTVSCIEYYRE
jgi:hypothetical protein